MQLSKVQFIELTVFFGCILYSANCNRCVCTVKSQFFLCISNIKNKKHTFVMFLFENKLHLNSEY